MISVNQKKKMSSLAQLGLASRIFDKDVSRLLEHCAAILFGNCLLHISAYEIGIMQQHCLVLTSQGNQHSVNETEPKGEWKGLQIIRCFLIFSPALPHLPPQDDVCSIEHGKEQIDGCGKAQRIKSSNLTNKVFEIIHCQEKEAEATPVGQPESIVGPIRLCCQGNCRRSHRI